jgi:hypothetical protein
VRHLPDTNFWHYALQLNTYKTIIEDKYGAKVVGLCLVCLHPDNANGTYQIIEVPFLEKEIADLFEYRRTMLLPKKAETKGLNTVPTGPKGTSTLVEKPPTGKPISGGPKQGYKPKGLMIDLGGL